MQKRIGTVQDVTLKAPHTTARRRGAQDCPPHAVANEASPAHAQSGPPRYKMALLTWIGAYAVITLILGVLGDTIAAWPLLLRTLLVSVVMVVLLTWLVIPAMTRLFRGWLRAKR